MHIGLVSDHTLSHSSERHALTLRQCVNALTTLDGFDVHWLLSTHTIAALAHDPALRLADASDMPPTCRYVIPYTLYRLDEARLIALEPSFWHDTALHTRLFSFLCLLHRQQPFDVLQAWGALSPFTSACTRPRISSSLGLYSIRPHACKTDLDKLSSGNGSPCTPPGRLPDMPKTANAYHIPARYSLSKSRCSTPPNQTRSRH